MALRWVLALSIAPLLLAGCQASRAVGTDTADGNSVTITADNASVTLQEGVAPRNLPAYAPIMPGATIEGSLGGVVGGAGGGMVSFTVPVEPVEVIAFYQKAAVQAGLSSTASAVQQTGGTQVLIMSQTGTQRSINVVAEPGDAGRGSKVALTYGI